MVLALECVRDDEPGNALSVLNCGDDEAWKLYRLYWTVRDAAGSRLLRARLALLLRTLLRADAGDYGRCYLWGRHGDVRYAPVRPLWELAPPHEVKP
jgi:hypothetical protein